MRKSVAFIVKLMLSAGLLFVSLRNVDFPALASRIDLHSLKWLALSIVLLLAQLVVGALRWHEISGQAGAPLPSKEAIRFTVIGAFFNQTLPSSVGGDAVRLLLLSRKGAGWRAATYSVFVDRAIGLITLAIGVALSLPWSFELITNPPGRITLALVVFMALGAGLGFLAFGWLPWAKLKSWRPTHHIQACAVIANRALFGRTIGLRVIALSTIVHCLTVAIAWCVAMSISAPVSLLDVFLLIPPVLIIAMLPISVAGWGIRETAMMVAFGYAGLPEADGVNVSLLFGAMTFIVGAMGGVMWVGSSEKRSAMLASTR